MWITFKLYVLLKKMWKTFYTICCIMWITFSIYCMMWISHIMHNLIKFIY
jgi:hypothetical protein